MDKKKIKQILRENNQAISINSIIELLENSSVGFITAFRNNVEGCCTDDYLNNFPTDGGDDEILKFNQLKNSELHNDLSKYTTHVTLGGWLDDNGVWVDEPTFLVVDNGNNPNFTDEMTGLGRKYCQDSVIVSTPWKGTEGNVKANIVMYKTQSCGAATVDLTFNNVNEGKSQYGYTTIHNFTFHFE